MNPRVAYRMLRCLGGLVLAVIVNLSRTYADTNDAALLDVGGKVLRMMQDRDAGRFAREMAPSIEDWRSISSTNGASSANSPDSLGSDFQKSLGYGEKAVSNSVRRVFAQADRLGLVPSRVRFRVKEVSGTETGKFRDPRIRNQTQDLPFSFNIRIILVGEPVNDAADSKALAGEYELALGGSQKFPTGWRTYEGIRWSHLPDAVADDRARLELRFNSKVAGHTGGLRGDDDPALQKLGEIVLRLVQQQDVKGFETNAMRSHHEVWREFDRIEAKGKPSRAEFDEVWGMMHQQILGSAQDLLAQATRLGLDFAGAQITLNEVETDICVQRGGFGALQGTQCGQVRFALSVQSDRKSKGGRSISGDYVINASRPVRDADRWTIEDKIRWEKIPDGLLGPKELKDLEFENYVAENGALPPGTVAPDISFSRIDYPSAVKLSDFKGKVLVLDWWATTCGPCQHPMAELQKLREQHPEWSNKVEIVTISIDEKPQEAQAHLAKRGWTNTFNAWAGPGSWNSDSAKAFRLHGIPTCYIISLDGKVVEAGHSVDVPELVSGLLRK